MPNEHEHDNGKKPLNGADGYKSGNKKPPRHSQFKEGESGNPSGRLKRGGGVGQKPEPELG